MLGGRLVLYEETGSVQAMSRHWAMLAQLTIPREWIVALRAEDSLPSAS